MGAGIALSIRKQWPSAYKDYINAFRKKELYLSNVIISTIEEKTLYVAHLCGQNFYGRTKRYTDYTAVEMCLKKVKELSKTLNLSVFIPFKMGCSLAGGDWTIVYKIINEIIPNATICYKEK